MRSNRYQSSSQITIKWVNCASLCIDRTEVLLAIAIEKRKNSRQWIEVKLFRRIPSSNCRVQQKRWPPIRRHTRSERTHSSNLDELHPGFDLSDILQCFQRLLLANLLNCIVDQTWKWCLDYCVTIRRVESQDNVNLPLFSSFLLNTRTVTRCVEGLQTNSASQKRLGNQGLFRNVWR